VIVFSSTIAPGDVTRPTGKTAMPDADGLALPRLVGVVLAAVADRLGVGLATVDGAAVFDGVTAGLLVAGAGATAGAGAALLNGAGAATDETDETGALVEERLAVHPVVSMAGASPSMTVQASIRRMRAILPDHALSCPHCRLHIAGSAGSAGARFDPPHGWSVLLGVGALRACPFPRAVSQS
jgi:hypothetical protein